jgi:hypothetical protein
LFCDHGAKIPIGLVTIGRTSLVGVGHSGLDSIVLLMLHMVCCAMAKALALYYRSLGTTLKLILTNFSLKTQWKDFGSLGAYQGKETGVRNERWDRLFIGKIRHQLSDRAADVQQP